jgi:thiamine-monophosphate kinase
MGMGLKSDACLADIGEKNIVNDVIYGVFPELKTEHDDAVLLNVTGLNELVLSTDPCPEPVAGLFDPENRFYHYGRMSVLINYSDIAAEGAVPVGILLATEMETSMMAKDYRHFLTGVKEACDEWKGPLLGGNVKEGGRFSVIGTSIGKFEKGARLLKRTGSKDGDLVCVAGGELGMFWLAVLTLWSRDSSLTDLDKYTRDFLLEPRPKLEEGAILGKSEAVTACMDSSDGVIGCLYEFAKLNEATVCIDARKLVPNAMLVEFCARNQFDYRNLMLSWGGWELVFTCKPGGVDTLKDAFKKAERNFYIIGTVEKKRAQPVIFREDDTEYSVADFSSKRFDSRSYLTYGLDKCVEQLRQNQFTPLGTLNGVWPDSRGALDRGRLG